MQSRDLARGRRRPSSGWLKSKVAAATRSVTEGWRVAPSVLPIELVAGLFRDQNPPYVILPLFICPARRGVGFTSVMDRNGCPWLVNPDSCNIFPFRHWHAACLAIMVSLSGWRCFTRQ